MSELKPCPFCGNHSVLEIDEPFFISGSRIESVTIYCSECDAEMTYDTEEQAIDMWNNRPHENKMKADAVLGAANEILGYPPLNDNYDKLEFINYANKLERGEL